jgi:subtilase family serine protease
MTLSFVTWLRNTFSSRSDRRLCRLRRQHKIAAQRFAAEIQLLEARVLLSGNPASQVAQVDLVRYASGIFGPQASGSQTPTGYTPAQIKQAYGFNQISFNGVAGDGTGTTIAIVDSYDDPNIANDLHQFDLAFGLPDPPNFTKVNQLGKTTSLPAANAGWITEIALDVEWSHAIAPGANILLVEANSDNDSDLNTAINTARNYAGVDVVSMSWGGDEYNGETFDDSFFTTPAGHTGVTFVASSGDDGAPTSYPSSSPNVVSVGGTTLNLTASGNWTSETAWSGSGGGISADEAQPAYQKGVVTQTTAFRADPDVSYDANPNTGFGVYDSYNNGTARPWGQWGGTSDAAPQWAALIAIADQGRTLAGEGSLDGPSQTLPLLYSMSAKDFHDITSGTSTGSPRYSAGPGYDLVTGRGTPFANLVVSDLIGKQVSTPAAPTLSSISTLGTATGQVPFSISYATLLGDSNAQDFNNAPIQFRINSVQNGTLSLTHNGVTAAVVPGSTLFVSGDTLTWTSAAGVSGSAVNAFTVIAFDGTLSSSSAVEVNINVQSITPSYNLSGPWIVNNAAGTQIGLGQINQNGSNLAFVNANGVSSAGQFASSNQVTASNFDNISIVTATVDTSTPDNGRILWSDGTVWLRVSLAGQYSVAVPGSSTPTLASITQNGTALTLINGATTNSATVSSASLLTVSLGGGSTATATYANGKISFSNNGQVWTKLDLPANYTNQAGAAVHILQNGASLIFVDKFGNTSAGFWNTPTQVVATGWGNELGTVSNGTIVWQGGIIWSENISLNGAANGTGTTQIAAAPSLVTVLDYVNASTNNPVHVVETGTNNVIFVDALGNMASGTIINSTQAATPHFPGQVATFYSNEVVWSGGTVWLQTSSTSAVTVTSYTSAIGLPFHVIQNGTGQLAFVDGLGNISLGSMQSASTFAANANPGDVATIAGSTINWQDGSVWTQTNAVPLTISLTDTNGAVSHVALQTPTTLVGLDGPLSGLTGTRQNGTIVWSNGTVWDNFDFNALNAFFEMANGFS